MGTHTQKSSRVGAKMERTGNRYLRLLWIMPVADFSHGNAVCILRAPGIPGRIHVHINALQVNISIGE